jgi:putative nucleotidyltransferase with HDIG domain
MDREEAWSLIEEFIQTDKLKKHAIAVEASMRAYAIRVGEDEDLWGVVGMLHDFDYEICPSPEEHAAFGAAILKERGCSENIVRAILSHANHTGVIRESPMEKALFATDELSGFITAVALVRPNKSLSDTTPKSVRKKMKDKAFARNVSREDIIQGAEELNIDLDELIQFVIDSLKPVAGQLGLSVE